MTFAAAQAQRDFWQQQQRLPGLAASFMSLHLTAELDRSRTRMVPGGGAKAERPNAENDKMMLFFLHDYLDVQLVPK